MAATELEKTILRNSANLLQYTRFEGNSNATVGINGTDTNISYGAGVFGNGATSAANSGDGISLGNSATLNFTTAAFSFIFWIKPNSPASNDVLISRGSDSVDGYLLQYSGASRTLKFRTSQSGTAQETNTSIGLTNGAWNHVAVTRDGSSVKIYINGAYANSTSGSHTNPASSTRNFYLLRYDSAGLESPDSLDDFAIFDTALSADQIKELYEGRNLGELRPQTGLVGLWHLNGNSTDFSGNNNHGTDTAITYSQANGKFGQGAGFNGSTSKISINNNLGIANSVITFGVWFKVATQPSSGGIYALLMHNSSTVDIDHTVNYKNTSGTYSVELSRTKQGVVVETVSYNCGQLSGWHYLVATDTGSAQVIYLDGKLVATGTLSGNGTSGGVDASSIGCADYNGTVYNRFNGSIDEAHIFNVAKSASWVRQQYSLGRFGEL